ncbi:hypothetical protein K7X08_011173 [Anisodus acutangulus]|uniref:Uncharacterized protein n=1 Tax=Anisodus acutangulus TaxID=402998 RepID=A0A9Q1LY88_9SOLA|nr:hypothetical protein K7X08_011173 [Anisodus acutangulus]
MSPSPSPRGSSHVLSNLCLRDSSSKPELQPWTLAMSQTRAPIPISTLAPASGPAPDQDLQRGDVDMMGKIMIVPEGDGFYPNHETTKAILDVV